MTRTPDSAGEDVVAEDSAQTRRFAAFESVADLRTAYESAITEGFDSERMEVLSNSR